MNISLFTLHTQTQAKRNQECNFRIYTRISRPNIKYENLGKKKKSPLKTTIKNNHPCNLTFTHIPNY